MSLAIEMLSKQGYIPSTCTLPEELAFPLVMAEISAGRNPCWGCSLDRAVCNGQPRRPGDEEASDE